MMKEHNISSPVHQSCRIGHRDRPGSRKAISLLPLQFSRRCLANSPGWTWRGERAPVLDVPAGELNPSRSPFAPREGHDISLSRSIHGQHRGEEHQRSSSLPSSGDGSIPRTVGSPSTTPGQDGEQAAQAVLGVGRGLEVDAHDLQLRVLNGPPSSSLRLFLSGGLFHIAQAGSYFAGPPFTVMCPVKRPPARAKETGAGGGWGQSGSGSSPPSPRRPPGSPRP